MEPIDIYKMVSAAACKYTMNGNPDYARVVYTGNGITLVASMLKNNKHPSEDMLLDYFKAIDDNSVPESRTPRKMPKKGLP